MTSDSQHYWQADPGQPDDDESPRGFGVFDSYTSASSSSLDDFPPDSEPPRFAGFPSDDPLMGDLPGDGYVPAPAALPIPGVRHDPEPLSSPPSWSSSLEPDLPSPQSPPSPPSPSSSDSWAAFAAGESPKLAAAPTEWKSPSPATYSSGPASDWNQISPGVPVSPPPPPPAPPAPASGRVSASVSVPNIIAPDDTPIPPEMPKPVGRVYGSSTAAVAPEAAAPAAAPTAPPPAMAPPADGPAAAARATARVSVARPEPGDAPPPATRSSTVYGSSTSAAPNAAPPGQLPGRQGRPHAYGDLLAPAAAGAPVQAPDGMQVDAPPIPMQRGPEAHFQQAGPMGQPMGQPMGMPPGARPGGPAPHGPIMPPPPPDEAKPERKGRIIVGVLVICVALLAAAFGGLILVDKLFNGAAFAVGDCVKQSNTDAVRADCGDTGAFKITAAVSSPEQCEDQTQPHVQQGDKILCLAPVSGGSTDVEKTTTPGPGTGPTATPTQ